MNTLDVEVVVVGAGLAGSCVVQALLEAGVAPLAWLARPDAAPSSPPVALVHPFAGRSFQLRPGVAAAWDASTRWAKRVGPGAAVHWAPVHRFPTASDRDRLLTSLAKHETTLRAEFGDAAPQHTGPQDDPYIRYDAAYGIDLAGAVQSMHAAAKLAGIEVWPSCIRTVEPAPNGWVVHTDAKPWRAAHVVIAAGGGSLACLADRVDPARFESVQGVLLHDRAPELRTFAIAGGHACSTTSQVGWGSSYALPGAATGPSGSDPATQLQALDARLRARVPLPAFDQASRWTGERFVDRHTRRPFVDTLAPGLHVCTAFGSQGGLLAPVAALEIARRIATALLRSTPGP